MAVYIMTMMLETSAAVGIIVLLLKLLSAFINRLYAAKWRYITWIILAALLVVPFKLFLPEPVFQMSMPAGMVSYILLTTGDEPKESEPQEAVSQEAGLKEPDSFSSAVSIMTPADITPPVSLTLGMLLAILWMVGTAVFILIHFAGYFFYKKKVWRWNCPIEDPWTAACLQSVCTQLKISGEVPVFINRKITSPMIIGLIHPALLLPEEEHTEKDLCFILRHELIHYKRRDLWIKLLMVIANAVHWFNPLVYLMVHEANRDLELSCDDEVIKGADVEDRKAYSETILASIYLSRTQNGIFTTNFYGGTNAIKREFPFLRQMLTLR